MPHAHRTRRALGAVLTAPFVLGGPLACAPRGAPATSPAPRNAVAPPSSLAGREVVQASAIEGGKTVEQLFTGRFAGVTVTQATNGELAIRVRGGPNSFFSSEEPLYIVDGTPLPPGTGGVSHLNPYDIEKIEVLKNPADVALYGVRGANGVIRITTTRPGRR